MFYFNFDLSVSFVLGPDRCGWDLQETGNGQSLLCRTSALSDPSRWRLLFFLISICFFKVIKGEHWFGAHVYISHILPPFITDDFKITWTEQKNTQNVFWSFWKYFSSSELLKLHFRIRSELLSLLNVTCWASRSSLCGFWCGICSVWFFAPVTDQVHVCLARECGRAFLWYWSSS